MNFASWLFRPAAVPVSSAGRPVFTSTSMPLVFSKAKLPLTWNMSPTFSSAFSRVTPMTAVL